MKIFVSCGVLSFRIHENHGLLLTRCYQERYFLASGHSRHPRKKSPYFNTTCIQIYSVSLSSNDYQAKLFLYVCEPEIDLRQSPRFVGDFKMRKHCKLLAVDSVDYKVGSRKLLFF